MVERTRDISHLPVARFNSRSCGITSKIPSIKAGRDVVSSTKRILIMFKPDCLAYGMVPETLQLLKKGLDREKIDARFAGLVLLNLTPQLTDRIYAEHVGKDWYEGLFKPFMTAKHPNEKAVRAPIIAAMLEVRNDASRDVVSVIRKNVIGPTDVEEYENKDEIKDTLRYKLILEKGLLTWPFPEDPKGPNYNRIHCSANEKIAGDELYPVFGIKGILSKLYEPSAVKDVLSGWSQQGYADVPGVIRIPIHEYLGADPVIFSRKIIRAFSDNGCVYKDFDEIKAEQLIRSLNDMREMIQGQEFFFNKVTSSIDPTDPINPLKPRVVAIFGAPGSGKTTISDILKNKGVVSILPLTVNEEREKSGATEYELRSKTEILRMIRENEFVGWEILAGNYYGISKRTAEMILRSSGKTFALLAGPTIVYPLREALKGKADFYQVMFKVPPNDLASRITKRATVRDRERGIALSLETQKWMEESFGNFDLITENPNSESETAAAQKLIDFLAKPQNVEFDRKKEASTLAATYPYNAVEMFKDQRQSFSNKDIVTLEKQVMSLVGTTIEAMYRAVRSSLPAETDLGVEFNEFLSGLILHTAKVLVAGIQLRSFQYEDITASPIKFGRIGLCSSKERADKLYKKLKDIQNRMPLEEEMLFDLVHDIGKMENIIQHPEKGYEIAKRLKMFEGWGVEGIDTDVDLIAIKCSHLIGSYMLPDNSLIAVADELSHKDVKSVLARKDGSVDMERMKNFLEKICFFPSKDASGYKDGWLLVLFSEGYFAFGEWLYSVFSRNSDNYDNAIAEIKKSSAGSNMDRIAKCVAMEDADADVNGRTFEYYRDNIVMPNVRACVDEWVFTQKDWDLVVGNLHHISKLRYSTNLICDSLQWIGAKGEKIEDLNNYRNMFKLFVIMAKSLIAFSKDPSRPGDFEFRFTYDDGKEIMGPKNWGPAMDFCNDQLDISTGDIEKVGNSISIVPKEKSKLPNVEITEEIVDGCRLISFKLKGYSGQNPASK